MTELTLSGPADVDLGLLLLRVLVGVTFSLHGFQKLFGWFGGGGFDGTSRWFASLGFGDGRAATLLAGGSEVAGGLGLALGLLTPLAAAAVIGTMTTAAWVNHTSNGFWSASKGWETNGYLIAVAWALATTGPGRLSLDRVLADAAVVEVPAGVVPGLVALAVGTAGGTLRWTTRDRTAD
ncbi:MAG: DoxX family protein [Actinomycetes bacterium]